MSQQKKSVQRQGKHRGRSIHKQNANSGHCQCVSFLSCLVKYLEGEELLEELDKEKSEEEFLSTKDEHAIKFNWNNNNNDCNNQGCITSIGIVWNTLMQANSKQKSSVEAGKNFCFSSLNFGHLREVTEFKLVTSCKNGDVQLKLQALESENVWIMDTGATSHVTKH